jgi:ergothioneine biosynthesis protein EgtB
MDTHIRKTQKCDDIPAITRIFDKVRARSLALASPLSAEDQTVQSMPDVSPTKWHLAHTTWFFETFILRDLDPAYRAYDTDYHFLFNSYYEAEGPRHARPKRGLLTRPGLDDILHYRAHVDHAIRQMLDRISPQSFENIRDRLVLGINHEEQHQELILMDIKHVFSENPMRPAYDAGIPSGPAETAPALEWIRYDGGLHEIGHMGDGFAFDNESPRHKTYLYPFALANRPVTNGDYLEFMEDGGYSRPEFWLSDGWYHIRNAGWQAPLYWRPDDQTWTIFTLGGERPIDPQAPVCHLSYYEADAYARWAGARLPTEQEWEVAAALEPREGHFLDRGQLQPDALWATNGRLHKIFGDVWEWTSSAYAAYPGFRPDAGAIGEYNGKFMCNQFVLRGGACVTPAQHVRASYRNFFPPHSRWMFSGLRLARDS